MPLVRIISGGQTGVDRAALDAAWLAGVAQGGFCPRGRRAEDGVIPPEYPLEELESAHYPARTEQNVLAADATLILYRKALAGGTLFTQLVAQRRGRPYLAVDLNHPPQPGEVAAWIAANEVQVLNVAGPRESQSPGIGAAAREYLGEVLAATNG